jgi:hypothetical protein
MVHGDGLLHVLGQVVPQVPAVGDLDRGRRALPGAVGVGAGPVPADHLGAGMRAQPAGEGVGLAVGEQVDRAVGGHVDQDRAVDVPAAQREVVHAEHRHTRALGVGQARSSRSSVDRLALTPRMWARRAPARPASAKPTASSSSCSSGLRLAYREVRPGICSAKVRARQSWSSQKKRRTRSRSTTRRPPIAGSCQPPLIAAVHPR